MVSKITITLEIGLALALVLTTINYFVNLIANDIPQNKDIALSYVSEDIYASLLSMERLGYPPEEICNNLLFIYPNLEVEIIDGNTIVCGSDDNYSDYLIFVYYYNNTVYPLKVLYKVK